MCGINVDNGWEELVRYGEDKRRRNEAWNARFQAFTDHFGVCQIPWTWHNLRRLLDKTGEPKERIDELLGWLELTGMGGTGEVWIHCPGIWDRMGMWAKDGQPCMIVGQSNDIHGENGEYRATLDDVAQWSPRLLLSIDDRGSYHFPKATHHFVV
jgi:hypothetical protein